MEDIDAPQKWGQSVYSASLLRVTLHMPHVLFIYTLTFINIGPRGKQRYKKLVNCIQACYVFSVGLLRLRIGH